MSTYLEQRGSQLLLHVKAVLNSSRTQVAGPLGDALKIKVAQPPEDGKANKAIAQLLAGILGVPQNNIILVSGQSRAQKSFQIRGLTLEDAQQKLGAAAAR